MMWPIAKVFDGNDQIARVVEIRTRRGSYVRPVHRLSLFLPAEVSHGINQEINKYQSHQRKRNLQHWISIKVNNKDPKIKTKDKDNNPTYSFHSPHHRNQTIQQHH